MSTLPLPTASAAATFAAAATLRATARVAPTDWKWGKKPMQVVDTVVDQSFVEASSRRCQRKGRHRRAQLP